jgi:hypothetical protein
MQELRKKQRVEFSMKDGIIEYTSRSTGTIKIPINEIDHVQFLANQAVLSLQNEKQVVIDLDMIVRFNEKEKLKQELLSKI